MFGVEYINPKGDAVGLFRHNRRIANAALILLLILVESILNDMACYGVTSRQVMNKEKLFVVFSKSITKEDKLCLIFFVGI